VANGTGQLETWLGFYAEGENPNGMVAHTANGVVINGTGDDGHRDGYNYAGGPPNADGPRWNRTADEAQPLMETGMIRVGAHYRRKR
jgi:hypothetical protein